MKTLDDHLAVKKKLQEPKYKKNEVWYIPWVTRDHKLRVLSSDSTYVLFEYIQHASRKNELAKIEHLEMQEKIKLGRFLPWFLRFITFKSYI